MLLYHGELILIVVASDGKNISEEKSPISNLTNFRYIPIVMGSMNLFTIIIIYYKSMVSFM